MVLKEIYNFDNLDRISDVYTLTSNFGTYDGADSVTILSHKGFEVKNTSFSVLSEIETENDVFMRKDVLKNTSEQDMHIYHYAYRFCLPGSDYDVYTQLNHWQNESGGEWQNLVTEVCASSYGLLTTSDATPMMALWDKCNRQGIVFHLFPQFSWKISACKRTNNKNVYTVIEISIADNGLDLVVKQNECLGFAPVIYYEFGDKQSLDCHKLHNFLNKKYPRRSLPVMYNTWLACFDRVNFEVVSKQVEEAAEIGCEYFVLDAGWFGDGDSEWYNLIGHWSENLTGAYKGRMKELSDFVREKGMKFGLWIEAERVIRGVKILEEHPEYYFHNSENNRVYFLDYANDEAREYFTNFLFELIEKYNIEYMKFDLNANLSYDKKRKAFYDYHKGYTKFINSLRQRYPDIYLECCASGGYRMELENLRRFDSFWFSDNQSPYEGLEIIKNTIKRMTPSAIDRWGVVVNCEGFVPSYGTDKTSRLLAIDNGTWSEVASVSPEFMCGFFSGGAPALSCDLTKLDSDVKEKFKTFIASFKSERDFWKDASCRILCDRKDILVLQYEKDNEIKLIVYTHKLVQNKLTVYPVIKDCDYKINGELRRFDDIKTNGITINLPENCYSYTFSLECNK